MEIISQKKLSYFIPNVLIPSLILSGAGLGMVLFFFNGLYKHEVPNWLYFLPLGSLISFLTNVKLIKDYFKSAPNLKIDNEKIFFKNQSIGESYLLEDISNIDFTGRFFNDEMTSGDEGMRIRFKDGKEKIIFNKYYDNLWRIKLWIYNYKNTESPRHEVVAHDTLTSLNNSIKFAGSYWLNQHTIFSWFFLGLFVLLPAINLSDLTYNIYALIVVFAVLMFYAFSRMLCYFHITADHLFIKNHHLFWINKAIKLSNIEEVVFIYVHKAGDSLQIIKTDFKEELYNASTLDRSDWVTLQKKLEIQGLKVRNMLQN